MNKPLQLSVSALIGILAGVLVFLAGALNSSYIAVIPIDPFPLLDLTVFAVAALLFVGWRRGPRWAPREKGLKRLIPGTPWGMFPIGVLLGLLVVGAAPMFLSERTATQTVVGTFLYPDEVLGIVVGVIAGVLFALAVDARLAAGFLFGYAVGLPSGLLITNPVIHDLFWTYGGFLLLFGSLALLHYYFSPLLQRVGKRG